MRCRMPINFKAGNFIGEKLPIRKVNIFLIGSLKTFPANKNAKTGAYRQNSRILYL